MNGTVFIIFVLFGVLAAAGCLIAIFAIKKKNAKSVEESIFLTKKKVGYDKWYDLYATFTSIGLTRSFVERLYKQYYILDPGNSKEVKERAVKTALVVWIGSFLVIGGVILIAPSLYSICCAGWIVYNFSTFYLTGKYNKLDLQLRTHFSKFMSEVRHNYFKHGMVDEAIYETFDKLDKQMQGHAMLIYNTLTAVDVEEAVTKYCNSAPNMYMKQFVSICYITMLYGDREVDGMSLFLKDIKDLKQSMDNELLNRNYVKQKFNMMDVVAMVPMFALGAARRWAIGVVPSLQKLYAGKVGLLLILAILLVSFVSLAVVKRLRDGKQPDNAEHPILEWFLSKRPVARWVYNFEHHYFSKTYKMKMLLKRTGSSYSTQTMMLHRIASFITAFIFTIVLSLALNAVQVNLALNDVREVADKGSGTTDDQNVAMIGLTTYYVYKYKDVDLMDMYHTYVAPGDKSNRRTTAVEEALTAFLLEEIKDSDIEMDDEDDFVIRAIQSYNSTHSADTSLFTTVYGTEVGGKYTLPDDSMLMRKVERDFSKIKSNILEANYMKEEYIYKIVAKSVVSHIAEYQDSAFQWWYVLIAIVVGLMMYMLPIVILKINEKELQNFMEDEVIQFQSVILILMHIDRMTVETILEEIVKFSFVFESSIRTCINSLASGEQEALWALYNAEPFEPFQRLVENLISCDRIGVKMAFNELDIERQNYIETRKQENDIKLSNRSSVASLVSYLPLYLVIGGYLVVPFVVEAFSSLLDSMNNI